MPPNSSQQARRRVVVVGGGLSAAAFTVQLLRAASTPIEVTIVEPRPDLGRGLAYSAQDPDYRLNAPLDVHWIDPERPLELRHWCESQGIFDADPECFTSNGQIFIRRSAIGGYLSDRLATQSSEGRLKGCLIRHVRDRAVSAHSEAGAYDVRTASGATVQGEMLVIATGNPVPSLRPPFHAEQENPNIIANPLDPGRLDAVPSGARVLVVGSGLTALDIVSTLVRCRHIGEIRVVSRRGYRPQSQSPETLGLPPKPVQLSTEVPAFLEGVPATVAAWTRALRKDIRRRAADGLGWHASFDAVRDVVWKLWPQLETPEKVRFARRLRVFYDVHRFRTPPMNEALVEGAERDGLVRYAPATLRAVDAVDGHVNVELTAGTPPVSHWHTFDVVINCTGLDAVSAWRSNPILHSLLEQGSLRLHPTGVGFDVTERCEALDFRGVPQPTLRVIGPPTAGAFGDPVAIPFIANQVHRILPSIFNTLQSIPLKEPDHEQASID